MTKNPVADAWSKAIADRIELAGYTRQTLANELGVTRQSVDYWVAGTNVPSARMQAALIDKLGIDPVAVAKLIRSAGAA